MFRDRVNVMITQSFSLAQLYKGIWKIGGMYFWLNQEGLNFVYVYIHLFENYDNFSFFFVLFYFNFYLLSIFMIIIIINKIMLINTTEMNKEFDIVVAY